MRVGIVLLSVGVLVAAAWLLLAPDDAPEPLGGATRARPPASVSIPDPDAGPVSEPEKAVAARPAALDAGPPDPPRPVAPPADEPDGLLVRIVDDVTGAPVAGTVVHVLYASDIPHWRNGYRAIDPEVLGRTKGVEHVADTGGMIAVTDPQRGFAISARHGERWAYRRYYWSGDPNPSPMVVRLRPDRRLRIRVVDADGEPRAGVAVALKDYDAIRNRFWQGETGADGVTEVSHIEWRLGGDEPMEAFGVTFHFPLATPVEKKIPGDALPHAPVELVLPCTTRLRVRVTGEGAKDEAEVRITGGGWSSADPAPERVTKNGEAVFPHVGVGVTLYAQVHPKNPEYPPLWGHRVQWSPAAGKETVVELPLGARYPILVGRAVNLRGRPIRKRMIGYHLTEWGGWSSSGLETDADGRFRFVLESDHEPAKGRELELEVADAAGLPGVARAVLDLSRGLPSGETDLGDVVFVSGGHVMSGRVVDAGGRPVAGAEILVYRGSVPEPPSGDTRRRYGGRPRVRGPERKQPKKPSYSWEPERDLFWPRTETDAEGRFSLHAVCPPGPLRIVVKKKGYYGEMARLVRRGATDERFVLHEAAVLHGSVRVASLLPRWCVSVEVIGPAAAVGFFANPVTWDTPDPPDPATATLRGDVDWESRVATGDGHEIPFRVEGLRPGPCRLVIRLDDQPEPVKVIESLTVRRDESRPAALQRIDLTWRLTTVRVAVGDTVGNTPKGAELRVFRGVRERRANYLRIKRALQRRFFQTDGESEHETAVTLVIDRESRLDLEVFAPGYRAVRLENVRRDRRVVLAPGLPVRIDLPRRTPDDRYVSVWLARVRRDGRPHFLFPSDTKRLRFGKELPASVTHRVPAPGGYRLTVKDGNDNEWARVECDVKDQAALQVFTAEASAGRAARR